MRTARLAAASALLALALPAGALLIRADRDDAEYLELATRYTSAVALRPGTGEGVLIAPRWILALARDAAALRDRRDAALEIAGLRYAVGAVLLPPGWKPGGQDALALIFLRQPVEGVAPTPIYRAADERGKGIVIVGHGSTGHIGAAPSRGLGQARGGINTIDRVAPALLEADIKSGDEASDLQGAVAADESGAPAYVETRQGLFVAGLALPPAPGASADRFVRVSSQAEWIDATMFRVATQEAAASTHRR